MKKKILFIINPISGAGKQKAVIPLLQKHINKNLFEYEVAYTNAPKHATELSKQAVKEDFDIVTAVGGDGSVNEVGRSLINTNTALAILPCGSGNGTARNLNISTNFIKAINIINQLKLKTIDTFHANEEPVINIAGVGFAAYVSHEFHKQTKRGFSNYIKVAIRDAIQYKSQNCTITYNNQTRKVQAFIIEVANGPQWGNGAVIAPQAQNNDSWLDLCIVKDFPRIILPTIAMRLFMKTAHRSKYVEIVRVKEVTICQENKYAHIDGDPYNMGNEIRFKINPLSLKVIAENV